MPQLESERLRAMAEQHREEAKPQGRWASSAQLEVRAIAAQLEIAAALASIAEKLGNGSSH